MINILLIQVVIQQQEKSNGKQHFQGNNKISRENANQIKETKNCW